MAQGGGLTGEPQAILDAARAEIVHRLVLEVEQQVLKSRKNSFEKRSPDLLIFC